ncbi:unnamed protein product [Cylindrotheca closterium]|uniref:Proteasome endopeptidase complex n=1 Tax=Cylindrotheca closterium TaxID=2856 RepID=A0AAD2G1G0_9STRA|nr:unnamed protein product [Cylindrotheca closterium]
MKSLALSSILCLRQLVAGTEYSPIEINFGAFNLEPDRLTERSGLSSDFARSRARLMESQVDNEDIDAWIDASLSNNDDDVEYSTSSIVGSRISKNQLSLHLEGGYNETPEFEGNAFKMNSPTRLPNTAEESYGNRYQYSGPKEEEPARLLDKKLLKKTGTTIAGCCVGQHVVLAADTRATEGTMVADKRCQKLHLLANNAWCAGAGTSADLDHLTKECLYTMSFQTLMDKSIGNSNSGEDPEGDQKAKISLAEDDLIFVGIVPIEQLCRFFQDRLFRARGNLGANLILGGVYDGKAHLRALHPHGSMDIDLPFTALGSGGLAAMGVLEEGYSKVQSVQEGIQLCERAILAGIKNDLGSGSQVDVCVIYPDGSSKMKRSTVPEEELTNEDVKHLGRNATTSENAQAPSTTGANGFGNLPFAVESKRTLSVREVETAQSRIQEWNRILGIDKTDKEI